jgi:hypothetical protein
MGRPSQGLLDIYRYGRGVEQALSYCIHGQLYRRTEALIADAAPSPGGQWACGAVSRGIQDGRAG